MSTKKKHISIVTLIALIGIIGVGLGILAFSLKIPVYRETKLNADLPQPLRGIVTQVELGKDGLQIELQTDYLLYNVTISRLQTEIIGSFDQIEAGTEIEVSGQEIAGTNPPLIVAEYVRVLGSLAHLTGKTWILTTYNGKQPVAGYEPSIQFIEGQVSGTTGCNHYGGSYQINGDLIKFDEIESTEMACMEPEGIMEQEQAYLELLGSATRFTLVDGELIIYSGSQLILTYKEKMDDPVE